VSAARRRPRILIAPHVRELDTVLGRLRASIVYEPFLEKIAAAGGQPLTAWPGSPDVDDLMAGADGVLLIGGGDIAPERFGPAADAVAVDRARDEFETRLVVAARAHRQPLLGVCRGAQLLNVAHGGTLRRLDGHRQEGDLTRPSHPVELVEGTRLAATLGTLELDVNSFHSWAPDALGRDLRISGVSADGIEALEFAGPWWAIGIQWHLELLDDQASERLFGGLVAAAGERAP
jgi:gamma-glutamyl-gamma-aminobutyrate hydrolase PuuD